MSQAHAELADPAPEAVELVVRKSVFRTSLLRVRTEDEARAAIAEVRSRHPQARHHCTAFVIGPRRELQRSNDDGEPSGTAGVPMLNALLGHTIDGHAPGTGTGAPPTTNVLAVVSRWFGGVKLGAGGLTRAYGQAVGAALAQAAWCQRSLVGVCPLDLDLSDQGRVETALRAHRVRLLETTFGHDSGGRPRATIWLAVADESRLVVEPLVAQVTGGVLMGQPTEHRWVSVPLDLPVRA